MSDFKYFHVLNIPDLLICLGSKFLGLHWVNLFSYIWQCSEYVPGCSFGRVLDIPGFWISHVSEYARVTQGFSYTWIQLNVWINCSTMAVFWICLVKLSQGFERACNLARLWICEGYTGCWICLNKPEYALISLNMSKYALIMLKMFKYTWVYVNKRSSEYARILMCHMQYTA